MHKQNFATQPRDLPTISEEAWRFLHATGRPSTALNGQNDLLHLGSSSADADDPPIWKADVSSNHSEMSSGRRILVSASSQMSLAHFGAQATPPLVGEEAQNVRPQTMEKTVAWVMSPSSSYTTLTVGSRCAVGKGKCWSMPVFSLMMEIMGSQLDKPRLFLVATNRVHVNIVVIINAIVLYILVFMYLLEIKLLLLQHEMRCNPPGEGGGEMVMVDGAMNRHRYIQILRNQMLPWAKCQGSSGRWRWAHMLLV